MTDSLVAVYEQLLHQDLNPDHDERRGCVSVPVASHWDVDVELMEDSLHVTSRAYDATGGLAREEEIGQVKKGTMAVALVETLLAEARREADEGWDND